MASLTRRLRLPQSPADHAGEARFFVLAGFCVAAIAVMVYGNDFVVPLLSLGVVALGHLVSYRERLQKRGLWRQILLAGLIFCAPGPPAADSGPGPVWAA